VSTLLEVTAPAAPGPLQSLVTPPLLPGVGAVGPERTLVELYPDDPSHPYVILQAVELFEPSCFVLMPEHLSGINEHPLNSYDISYPYCRTAVKVMVDAVDPNPLLAEVTSFSRYLSIRIIPLVCGLEARLTGFRVLGTNPAIVAPCAAVVVIQPMTGQGFLVIDGTKVLLPSQVLVEMITADGSRRLGWINVLPPGWVEE
jgi:hypothetical protein